MIKRFFRYLCLFIPFICFGKIAEAQVKQKKVAQNEQPNKASVKGLLWEISGNGLTKSSYLFGTIHLICKDDFFWTDAMERALQASEVVCMEMDMDDPALQMQMAQNLMLSGGAKLTDYFETNDYDRLNHYFTQKVTAFPARFLPNLKPTAVMMLLMTQQFQCAETESYEMNIMGKAKKDGKEINGLENMSAQMKALESMGDDYAITYINDIVNNKLSAAAADQFLQMVNLYKAQDIYGIYEMTNTDSTMKLNLDAILLDRNKSWIPLMAEMMSSQKVFFAVGAAHLAGGEGVITLLRNEGYTVSPVQP